MRGWAAVTGVAELKPSRWTRGETTMGMFARTAMAAVADAGLELADIDGIITHPMAGIPMLVPSTVIEMTGIRASFAETVDLGGATGAGMIWRAAAAIHAGQANAVVCVTAARREKSLNFCPLRWLSMMAALSAGVSKSAAMAGRLSKLNGTSTTPPSAL